MRFLAGIASGTGETPAWLFRGLLFMLPIIGLHVWTYMLERGQVQPLTPRARIVLAALMILAMATLSAPSSAFIYFQF
jgi:hypothetical protein